MALEQGEGLCWNEWEPAEIREIVELCLAGIHGVIAAPIGRETVAGRRSNIKRVCKRKRYAWIADFDRRGDACVLAGRESNRALNKLRGCTRPIDHSECRACSNRSTSRECALYKSATGVIKDMLARRRIDIPRHHQIEQNKIRVNRDFCRGATNAVDGADAALEQDYAANRVRGIGGRPRIKKRALALNFCAIKDAFGKRLQHRIAANRV
jgi:hypothetical protein